MDFKDDRKKDVVYLCHCLLNQNTRGPGVAFREDASVELLNILQKNGVNIEQLPCLECAGMGGVSRRSFDRFLPVVDVFVNRGWSLPFGAFVKSWLIKYEWLCRREAVKVVKRIEDFIQEDCSVLGVVGMNDSPTCGVTKTLDFTEMIRRIVTDRNEVNPMRQIIRDTLIEGPSYFVGSIVSELKKRKIDLKVVGFEPWAASLKDESERVARELDLAV